MKPVWAAFAVQQALKWLPREAEISMYTMRNHTKSSLFESMAALLAQIRAQEKCIAEFRGELAYISFSAEHGDASAVASRAELLSKIAAAEARLNTLREELEAGEHQAAEARQHILDARGQRRE